MNKTLKFELFTFFFVSVFGVLLHFSYDWSNKQILFSLFSAVNESCWEHLKLLFFPSVFTLILANILNINEGDYLTKKLFGIIYGMLFIIIFYYTYTGVIGKDIPFLDISSFFVAAFISSFYTLKKYNTSINNNLYYIYFLIFLFSCLFITFTFKPLHINLFKDPVENYYGIKKSEY